MATKRYYKDYTVHKVDTHFIVVNNRNAKVNKRIFDTEEAAKEHARKLAYWHKGNKMPNGLARTAAHNEKFVKQYHAKKEER